MNSLEARKLLLGLKGICGLPELLLEGTGGGIPGKAEVGGAPQPSKSNPELGNRACRHAEAESGSEFGAVIGGKGLCSTGLELWGVGKSSSNVTHCWARFPGAGGGANKGAGCGTSDTARWRRGLAASACCWE